jgi:hypothetical protein
LDKSEGHSGDSPRRSKKFINHWKQATSVSRIGNKTRSLLGKWKTTHSQSVDVGCAGLMDGAGYAGGVTGLGATGSDPCGIDGVGAVAMAGAASHAANGAAAGDEHSKHHPKTQWTEHVWSKSI